MNIKITSSKLDYYSRLFSICYFGTLVSIILFLMYVFVLSPILTFFFDLNIFPTIFLSWVKQTNHLSFVLSSTFLFLLISFQLSTIITNLIFKIFYYLFIRRFWNSFPFMLYQKSNMPLNPPKVLFLFPTCDDFITRIIEHNIKQDYVNVEYWILDDSRDNNYIKMIDNFIAKFPNVNVYRRPNRFGYKGGNIDNFLLNYQGQWDYYAITDADVMVMTDFISKNICLFYSELPNIGYIQIPLTAYDTGYLTSSALRAKLEVWSEFYNFMSLGTKLWYYDTGIIVSKKCYDEIGKIGNNVNCDTSFITKAYQCGFHSFFSNLSFSASMEPRSLYEYTKRDMRWIMAQYDILYSNKYIKRIYNSDISFFSRLFTIAFYNGWKILPILELITMLYICSLFTIQQYLYMPYSQHFIEIFIFKNITPLDFLFIIFLCYFGICLIFNIIYLIFTKHRKEFMLYLIFAKRFAQYESLMSFHTMLFCWFKNLIGKRQISYDTTPKGTDFLKMPFFTNFYLMRRRIIIGIIFIICTIVLIIIQITSSNIFLVGWICFFAINSLPGIYCILFGWFNNIHINSKTLFEFDVIAPHNKIRKKYGFEEI